MLCVGFVNRRQPLSPKEQLNPKKVIYIILNLIVELIGGDEMYKPACRNCFNGKGLR